MNNTIRIYNIHMVNGRVLSTPNCPIMTDSSLQLLPFFIVPVAVEKNGSTYMSNHRFMNVRINTSNVAFIDESFPRNADKASLLDEMFTLQTIDTASLDNE